MSEFVATLYVEGGFQAPPVVSDGYVIINGTVAQIVSVWVDDFERHLVASAGDEVIAFGRWRYDYCQSPSYASEYFTAVAGGWTVF
ncbi:MAG: hypothetical protein GY832_20230 [Chloroflexi bacterium]|nr:hypothetical protein [Chloroflexota bacterium]